MGPNLGIAGGSFGEHSLKTPLPDRVDGPEAIFLMSLPGGEAA
jgi:hypothetical protein